MGIHHASCTAEAQFRLGHLRRRRLDPRAHPFDRQAHSRGNRAHAGRASHLRGGDLRGDRRRDPQLLRRRRAPHRGAARRSGRRHRREIRAASGRLSQRRRPGRRHQAARRRRGVGLRLSGKASRQPDRRGRPRHARGQGRRRRHPRHDPVLLRERPLFPLPRPGARARHQGADRARHPAGAELQADQEFRRALRRLGAGLAGRALRRPR